MKLKDLDPRLYVINGPMQYGETSEIGEAQGIHFLCPSCLKQNNGRGAHGVVAWFHGRDVHRSEAPAARYELVGTSLDDLTLTPVKDGGPIRSAGCEWSGAIAAGEVVDG